MPFLRSAFQNTERRIRPLLQRKSKQWSNMLVAFLHVLWVIMLVGVFAAIAAAMIGILLAALAFQDVSLVIPDIYQRAAPLIPPTLLFFLVLIGMISCVSAYAYVINSAETWRRDQHQEFQHAWQTWTTCVVAYHTVSVPAHTLLCLNPNTLTISGHTTQPVSRSARRHIWRHATSSLHMSVWKRTLLAYALQTCWKNQEHRAYLPPSAHTRLAAARIVRDRPVKLMAMEPRSPSPSHIST